MSTKHWHYQVEDSGCPRYVSKVSDSGLVLCSFAEVFPFSDAEQAAQEMVDLANAGLLSGAAPTGTSATFPHEPPQ